MIIDVFVDYMSMDWTDVFNLMTKFFFNTVSNNWFHYWTVWFWITTVIHWSKSTIFLNIFFPPYLIYDMR